MLGSSGNSGLTTRSTLEVAGVVTTGVAHLLLVNVFHAQTAFIAIVGVAYVAYIAISVWNDRRLPMCWGLRAQNFRKTALASSSFAIPAAVAMAVVAQLQGALTLHWHMLPLLILYPIWGLLQQLLVQALLARNLIRLTDMLGSTGFVAIICACLFSIVHLPDLRLAIATLLLGLAFTPIYLKWRNLWPLGIYHGWLGVLVYFWVLRRDPWLEVFVH